MQQSYLSFLQSFAYTFSPSLLDSEGDSYLVSISLSQSDVTRVLLLYFPRQCQVREDVLVSVNVRLRLTYLLTSLP